MVTQIPCVLLFWPVTSVHKGPPWCCNPEEWVWSNVGLVYISSYFNLAQDPVLWACSSKLSCSYLDCGHLIHFQDQHLACQLPGATLNMAASARSRWQLKWNRLNTMLKWKCHCIDKILFTGCVMVYMTKFYSLAVSAVVILTTAVQPTIQILPLWWHSIAVSLQTFWIEKRWTQKIVRWGGCDQLMIFLLK